MLMMYFTWGLSEQAYMVGLTKYICIRTKKNKITTTFGGNLEQGEFDPFLLWRLINSSS